MIRLAIIGSNWISHQFIDAALQSGHYQLAAIYSRRLEQAQAFARAYPPLPLFTDLDALARSEHIDAVYIASPNALHFSQICLFLQQKKHVICEKPLTASLKQTDAAIACARQHHVVLFEAFKTASLPNFARLHKALDKPGKLRKVFLNFCQYSSRYPRYLAGELPNTFNPAFCGGSIMDIGYYCLAVALALWGEPRRLIASASLLDSGVDAHGTVILQYPDFDLTLHHSKVSHSCNLSEIQGETGSLLIDKLSDCQSIHWQPREGEKQLISQPQHSNTMIYEARVFAQLVQQRHIDHPALTLSRQIANYLDQIRQQTGVRFPTDTQ